jgi:hypothetical protein
MYLDDSTGLSQCLSYFLFAQRSIEEKDERFMQL